MTSFEVKAIGRVESILTDLADAPRQADEGAPAAWLVFDDEMREGLRSLRAGDEVRRFSTSSRCWSRSPSAEGRQEPAERASSILRTS
jgi:tRNA (Thr-GGU) A37 N-methylase